MSNQIIIKNPRITTEKRPGPNYIKTPVSDYKEWQVADGVLYTGGIWYRNDKKAITSQIVEKIFNDRVINREYQKIAKCIEKGEDLSNKDDWKEKISYIKSTGKDSGYFDSVQHINKIDINSLYGALGNQYFHLFKLENALNTTLSGQHLIKYLAENFNNFFRNEFWKNTQYFKTIDPSNAVLKPIVRIIETDSVIGSSIITVNDKQMTISELYDLSYDKHNIGNNWYGKVNNCYTPSVNTTTHEIENNKITYVMKHTVKKELFEIEINGTIVTMTCDHSLMIKRNNKIIEVKPTEVIDGDELLYMKEDINE